MLSSDLKHILTMKKIIILITVPHFFTWCYLVNWLYISCKVTRKKKSAVNKWVTLTIGKIIGKSMKSSGSKVCKTPLKFLTLKGKEVALQKVANKMVAA